LDDLDDDLDNLAQPLLVKRFAEEGKNVPLFELDIMI
jgi:hypothetical protein